MDSGSSRVLIVEDEPDSGETLSILFEIHEFQAEVATNAADALTILRARGADLVICDLGLPDGPSGLSLAREIRDDPALEDIPLIAFSGFVQPRDRKAARAAGFDAHVAKPASIEDLIAVFRKVQKKRLKRRRTDREPPLAN